MRLGVKVRIDAPVGNLPISWIDAPVGHLPISLSAADRLSREKFESAPFLESQAKTVIVLRRLSKVMIY